NDIKSAISKARRALKSRTPNKEKAQKELDKAISAYQKQEEWRTRGETYILPKLSKYESTMRKTIGIRDQAKLTKKQALFVAKCQSGYRDVSLNF
ncbi:MAG: C4-dicarboxylate ABC transporter permease, partial [Rhodobacterales bacterium]